MAKKIDLLSPRHVNTKPNGFHADGGNLFLRVRDDSRVWIFRYKKAGKQTSIGLGATHARSLAEARELAAAMRNAIINNRDPAELVRVDESKSKTFKDYALELIEAKKSAWRNAKHAQQWLNTLTQYAFPTIGDKCLTDITLTDVKAILMPLWTIKTETASRVRMRIEAVLDYAIVEEDSDKRNPARWKSNLDKVFPAPNKIKTVSHFASAPYSDVPRIMSELRNKNCMSAYCLRFIILTAARSGEGRGALWSEINISTRTWTIPADRMKAKRDHVVPLCDEAVAILKTMLQWRMNDSKWVFPGARGGLLSDVALNKTLHAIAPDITVHGFRSSFRIWGAEVTSVSGAVLELALAHVNKNRVEAAYQRSDLFEHRRVLMTAWGDYCSDIGEVIQLRREKIA
ncbi:MAG: tyrosine-type recombinase/integrase [Legionella sp.]|nr:tyrosine-type recombinase/integrase [Legionella sp.]